MVEPSDSDFKMQKKRTIYFRLPSRPRNDQRCASTLDVRTEVRHFAMMNEMNEISMNEKTGFEFHNCGGTGYFRQKSCSSACSDLSKTQHTHIHRQAMSHTCIVSRKMCLSNCTVNSCRFNKIFKQSYDI